MNIQAFVVFSPLLVGFVPDSLTPVLDQNVAIASESAVHQLNLESGNAWCSGTVDQFGKAILHSQGPRLSTIKGIGQVLDHAFGEAWSRSAQSTWRANLGFSHFLEARAPPQTVRLS